MDYEEVDPIENDLHDYTEEDVAPIDFDVEVNAVDWMCENCGMLESEGICGCGDYEDDGQPTEQKEWEDFEGTSYMDCYQEPLDDW